MNRKEIYLKSFKENYDYLEDLLNNGIKEMKTPLSCDVELEEDEDDKREIVEFIYFDEDKKSVNIVKTVIHFIQMIYCKKWERHYHCTASIQEKQEEFLLKISVNKSDKQVLEDYLKMEIGAHYANLYNQLKPNRLMLFDKPTLIRFCERSPVKIGYTLSFTEEAKILDFNHLLENQLQFNSEAFSHFVYEVSDHTVVFSDFKGNFRRDLYDIYSDFTIHDIDNTFDVGASNKGEKGIQKYLKNHKCNYLCHTMDITSKSTVSFLNQQRYPSSKSSNHWELLRKGMVTYTQCRGRHYDRPIEILKEAGECGNTIALNMIGFIYMHNLKDGPLCLEYFKKASDLGDARSFFFLGSIEYYRKIRDQKLCLEYFQKSYELGSLEALHEMGTILVDGRKKFEKNEQLGIEYLKKAADAGYYKSLFILGRVHCSMGQTEKGIEYLKKYAEMGYSQGNFQLGMIHDDEDHYKEIKNYDLSREYLTKASDVGDMSSMEYLGMAFGGTDTYPEDENQSIEHFQRLFDRCDELKESVFEDIHVALDRYYEDRLRRVK